LNNGNMTIPRLAGGAIAGYMAREPTIVCVFVFFVPFIRQPSFDDVQLVKARRSGLYWCRRYD